MVVIVSLLFRGSVESETYVFEQDKFLESFGFDPQLNQGAAIATETYVYASASVAKDNGEAIDIRKHNLPTSRYIQYYKKTQGQSPLVFIVPGFVPMTQTPVRLHKIAKMRLNTVVKSLVQNPGALVVVTGGNVKPAGTPFNEALEMKRHLMNFHQVPEFLIALEPYAQNTVTNLRNSGRFLLAHGINKATVVTSFVQNTYISYPKWTSFFSRSQKLLGYWVGDVKNIDTQKLEFSPSVEVLQKSSDPVDP